MNDSKHSDDDVITIKKYANRRLYNTATSSYVTLDYLCTMVKEGKNFQVVDAKSGEDITRSVLAQIIFEEESKGQNLLPVQFLRQLIQFYGDNMQPYLPSYLEYSMEQFTKNQDQFRETLSQTLGGPQPFQMFEEQIRNNMSMFEQALNIFTPFSGGPEKNEAPQPSAKPETPAAPQEESDQISQLKDQMAAMQDKLNALAKDQK